MKCAKVYDCWFWFLQIIEDKTCDSFYRHRVVCVDTVCVCVVCVSVCWTGSTIMVTYASHLTYSDSVFLISW